MTFEFWARPVINGRWQLMVAFRRGMAYAEAPAFGGPVDAAEALDVLEQLPGRRQLAAP